MGQRVNAEADRGARRVQDQIVNVRGSGGKRQLQQLDAQRQQRAGGEGLRGAGELAEYEESIMDLYPRFLDSFNRGVEDGSVRGDVRPKEFYDTVNHAVMALSQKLLRGEILQGDSFRDSREPELLLRMASDYLRAEDR